MKSYCIKGSYLRGGWPVQFNLQICDTLSEAIKWCKGYANDGSLGGYDILTVSSDYDIEGWFSLCEGWEANV
jgi:hypothetical protein